MSLLLNIDTATEVACVSIADNGHILQEAINKEQKDHAFFLHTSIDALCKKANIHLSELSAVAVTAGPGSYTGLRVGMAAAKGMCFALDVPLITIGSLDVMAWQSIHISKNVPCDLPVLFCPMIDARRMEVFTAAFDSELNPQVLPLAMVLDENSFANQLLTNKIVFTGTGSIKWKELCLHKNAIFTSIGVNALYMSELSYKKYLREEFADIAYVEPLYVKEFFNGNSKL